MEGAHFVRRGVAGFGLARAAGEEDEAGAVGLEALDVGGEGSDGEVGAARVDADTDCWGEFAGDFGFLFGFLG